MKIIFFFICLFTIPVIPRYALGVELGGDLEIRSGLSYSDKDFKAGFAGRGEMEMFFPESDTVEPRLVYRAVLAEDGIRSGIKYMYIRLPMDKGHYTAGRQPVFWSYGSMLNLLDYRLGIEDLGEETFRSGTDGLRYHRHLGGGRSLQLVVSFQDFADNSWDELGYGSRLRLPGTGYDLSFNFFYQPVLYPLPEPEEDNLLRAGATYNRDIGAVGTYGSFAFFQLQDNDREDLMLQLGMDYSWQLGRRRMLLQAEYYRFLQDNLDAGVLAGVMAGGGNLEESFPWMGEEQTAGSLLGREMLLAGLSLQMDYFSSIGLVLMLDTRSSTGAISPYYITEMGGGLEMRFDGKLQKDKSKNFYGVFSTLNYYF
ncbi:MAG: hypothetical protein ACQESB_00610 [Elusimicrobiota bacterium]